MASQLRKLTTARQFADRLQAELDRKGWTTQDLVRAWGGSPMPYKWLEGRTEPRVDTKRRLAETLGIPMAALETTSPNGKTVEITQAEMAPPQPAPSHIDSAAAEVEVIKREPDQPVTVRLKVDALVTPSVANAVMRALDLLK